MLRKILISAVVVLALGAAGAYFFFVGKLYAGRMPSQLCRNVDIVLLDSAQNRFVTKAEVVEIMESFMGPCEGKAVNEINLHLIEKLLDQRSAIKKSQASITRDGRLTVEITQRKPVLRIQTENGGFYVDETKYIFPLVTSFTSYVPVVSGHIPFTLNSDHRGMALEDDGDWMQGILELGNYMGNDPFWSAQIEQIYVEEGGDVILSPRVGKHKIIFGDLKDIDTKFDKLYTFYKNIVPAEGWDKYSSVNLKYRDQIICKLKKNRKK